METLQNLFFPNQFIPHGHCYLWQPQLVWLHLLADVMIAIAYYSIPIMLVHFVRKRQDVPFPDIFLLFGLFITTCGTTHLMSVWTVWYPAYWLSGVLKAITAMVSIYTALALFPTLPAALALPSPEKLRQINQQLETEIEERKQAEAALQYQLTFDQLVSEISTRFINLAPEDVGDEINQALQTIGQFTGVDTSYLFQFEAAVNTFSMIHEWVNEGQTPQIKNAQNLPHTAFPWAIKTLRQGKVLYVPSVANLPLEAAIEKTHWQTFNLQSLISVPLMAQGKLLGWVGFASFQQEKVWSESSKQLLRMFAEILTRALQRQQAELALRQSESRLQMALEVGKTACWEHDLIKQRIQGFGRLVDGQWVPKTWQVDSEQAWAEIHPEDCLQVRQAILMALEAKGEFAVEHRLVRTCCPDQNEWVLTKGKVLENNSGLPTRIVGLTVDITERKQAEASLRESEERWQLALRGTNDGIWDWNVETNEVFYSPRFKQMLGYEDHEFANQTDEWERRVHPDDIEPVFAAVQAHFDQQTPYYQTEHRVRCKDGSYIWILDRAKVLRNEMGKVIRMTGSHTDITARKQAEADLRQLNQELETRVEERTAALKKSEQRFRSLFESAPDFIYVLDQQGVIQQVNSTVTKHSGYTELELTGQPLTKFLSNRTQAVSPQEFASILATGSHRQEMEFVCKDGQILTMDCSCTLVTDSSSDNYILVLQRDITERKKTEEERNQLLVTVQQSEQRWRSFLDNVRLMVIGLDASGYVNYVNPHCLQLLGYQRQEIEGKDGFETLLPQRQYQQRQGFFQSLLQDQVPSYYQSSVLTCSGEEKFVAWNTTVLKDTQGNSMGILSVGEDITERYAVDRIKDEFISVVSHELRTPLTSIHGALDLLATGLIDPQSDRGKHVFSLAVENSERLVQLVNDILELERLESAKIKLHQTSISTRELTQRAYELMELMAERESIQMEIGEIDLLVWGDGDRLIQVLTNLLSNAIKFSDPGSTVWVKVEEIIGSEGKYAQFMVKDQGRGIPADKVDQIFERFHQVDASESRRKGGTGLGLAICRSIIQQHNGKIWVQSVLGEGSCFFFTVPRHIE
ncbi:MAG: PAS domain S-box protein [Cyanobacteria bacterium P01_F01_bin.86]